jgi:hypothetical protein
MIGSPLNFMIFPVDTGAAIGGCSGKGVASKFCSEWRVALGLGWEGGPERGTGGPRSG